MEKLLMPLVSAPQHAECEKNREDDEVIVENRLRKGRRVSGALR